MVPLPNDLKHLYLTWLEEDALLSQRQQQKTAMLLNNALRTLRNTQEPIHVPEELKKLKGIGDWIVGKMRTRLERYCKENGFDAPAVPEEVLKGGRKRKKNEDDEGDDDGTEKGKKKVIKEYIPRKRSGAYAILLVLLEFDEEMMGMTKDLISSNATPYCDISFTANPGSSQFYSAWNSSKKLLQEGLIKQSGRPARFYLTDEGLELARKIKRNDEIVFRHEHRARGTHPSQGHSEGIRATQGGALIQSETQESQYADIADPVLPVFIPRDRETHEYRGTQYFFWEPGTYEVKFMVDNREIRSRSERDFFDNKLLQLGVECVKKPLQVGDGLWIARHKTTNEEVVLDYIMERKRLDDLAQSIQDGRYTEQKSRLKRTGIDNIFYLIEEVTSSDIQQMSQAIQTSISLAITVNNFHVQRTKDADATLQFIHKLTKQVVKYYNQKRLLVLNPSDVASQMDYANILISFKKKFINVECVHLYHTFDSLLSKSSMITVREMFVRMLMTVRGVTLEKAIAIQKQFKTPTAMFEKFDPHDELFISKYGKKVTETLAETFGKR
jgi:crossover junction endonuclease MUS81